MIFNSQILVFVGLIIGVVAYALLYLGKGIQKYAIEGLKIKKLVKKKIIVFGFLEQF